ncbi:hypothetical protein [Endozoicomonas sp. YOMI1]|uniref:hypothetical protein n=1 Tax=Endozoicomonas sp. YOMI1 TaxID=2828739 RepID=UPI0021488D2F|nr:hypothetical protein [Endozoicomonas sp. YOMI1]
MRDILQFIEIKLQTFDELVKEGEQTVSFLRERRTALISAAVTGKIDVRNWQRPKQQKHPEATHEQTT